MTSQEPYPYIIGISGASGAIISKKIVSELLTRDLEVVTIFSNASKLVWDQELDSSYQTDIIEWSEYPNYKNYAVGDLTAPIASGSYHTNGMIIVPCSMNSVASLANGITNNLLLRAADVCLKENRPLTIIPRETPLHAIHLNNLAKLASMGATIMPTDPPFYLNLKTTDQIVDYFVGKVLIQLGIETELPERFRYQGRPE
tara:strand:+ start:14352 stop:14954 length:603 start_codon:yes stop_codon:yes gene_type:complete